VIDDVEARPAGEKGLGVFARRGFSDGEFIFRRRHLLLNHSCDPNAMRHGVTVFAWRDVAAGEEITIDYRLNAFDGSSWPCACGASVCTGTVVGSYFAMDLPRQELLLPHAPEFFAREYRRRRSKSVDQHPDMSP
jgi:hypothetical protein